MKNILDKISAWIDRREVKSLRDKVRLLNDELQQSNKIIRIQIQQIGDANERSARYTNEALDLKSQLRKLT